VGGGCVCVWVFTCLYNPQFTRAEFTQAQLFFFFSMDKAVIYNPIYCGSHNFGRRKMPSDHMKAKKKRDANTSRRIGKDDKREPLQCRAINNAGTGELNNGFQLGVYAPTME
jgi:hypothetical protein